MQTLLAARETLENNGDYYRPFQLFGYDFLVDAELRVWLCEINASPAVADALLPGFCRALVRECIDPVCAPNPAFVDMQAYAAAEAAARERGECFELLYKNSSRADDEAAP